MEILLWLVPPAVVTVLAMLYVAWAGRDHRGEVDRDEAVRRLGKALEGRTRRSATLPGYAVDCGGRERSTGVAVRRPDPARGPQPSPQQSPQSSPQSSTRAATPEASPHRAGEPPLAPPDAPRERRAS